jgi:hypothetical protein
MDSRPIRKKCLSPQTFSYKNLARMLPLADFPAHNRMKNLAQKQDPPLRADREM